jgi:DNA mismatch repair protein MSH3
VPANSCAIGLIDGIFTRCARENCLALVVLMTIESMGASDSLHRGSSTFMTELAETSDILRQASARSLVILDELGRGTSTHDGVAIAHATLSHLVAEVCVCVMVCDGVCVCVCVCFCISRMDAKIKCLTLFVTHYPSMAELVDDFPGHIGVYHMSFLEDASTSAQGETRRLPNARQCLTMGIDGPHVTFLYQLVAGPSKSSFGLNVARLAGLPKVSSLRPLLGEASHVTIRNRTL